MMPISLSKLTGRAAIALKSGYSLLETMVALAIMSLAVAFIMPKAAGALDQVVVHTVQFDLQRQLSSLRQSAFASNSVYVLMPTDAAGRPLQVEAASVEGAEPAHLTLRAGWTYALAQPLLIGANARCTPASLELYDRGHLAMHLEGGADCTLIRKAG